MILLEVKLPADFFTMSSMVTLSGASAAVFVISNAIQHAFNFNPKWFALVLAELIIFVGLYNTTSFTVGDIFVGIINGFLVYSTTVGINQMVSKKPASDLTARGAAHDKADSSKRSFLTSWF